MMPSVRSNLPPSPDDDLMAESSSEGAKPGVSEVPLTILMDGRPIQLGSAAKGTQPPKQEKKKEKMNVCYEDGVKKVQTSSLRLGNSAPQGISVDATHPGDEMIKRLWPDQARASCRPRLPSGGSIPEDPGDSEMPQDIDSSMTTGLRFVSDVPPGNFFDGPYLRDDMTDKMKPAQGPQARSSCRPRLPSDQSMHSNARDLEDPHRMDLGVTTGLKFVSSAPQGTFFDAPYPDDNMTDKVKPARDTQARASCRPRLASDPLAGAGDLRVPQGMDLRMATALKPVWSAPKGIFFDAPYFRDDISGKSNADLDPQAHCSYRPRLLSDQSTRADSEDLGPCRSRFPSEISLLAEQSAIEVPQDIDSSMTTGLRVISLELQGILFDEPFTDDDTPYKFGQFGPDHFLQARCAYELDAHVDSENEESLQDIVSSMTKGLQLVSSAQQDIVFDVPYRGDSTTHKFGPDLLPQPLCSDRPRLPSDHLKRADSGGFEVPLHVCSSNAQLGLQSRKGPPNQQLGVTGDSTSLTDQRVMDYCASTHQRLPTTLMIRNIPQMYSQKELVLEWPNKGSYDFFYLPMSNDPEKGHKTFAFINFTSAQAAVAFRERWEKQRLPKFAARRTLNVTCADVQGREANMRQLQKGQLRRLKNKECQPMVFEDGVQVSFEEVMARLSVCVQEESVADMQ